MTDSPAKTAQTPDCPANTHWRDIVVVVAIAWAARLVFMWLIPPGAHSFDAYAWEHQALLLKQGLNPYQTSRLFSWPPFWMQCVFVISKIADGLGVPFFRVLQVFLILSETGVMVVTMRLIQRLTPTANVRILMIVGMALNPVAILLTCQHGNFDVIMVLWVLLAIACLMRYNGSEDVMDWLGACLFLGLGILTKTVPVVMVPLLAGGFRKATLPGKLLGATLLLGPAALGMSVIYVLSPAEVLHQVIEYRATGFPAGFEGLLNLMDCKELVPCTRLAFYVLELGVMVLTWRHLWPGRSFGNRELALYSALIFMLIAGEGTGFGAQYFYWFLPFLVIAYAAYPGSWRKLLIGFGIISAITFIINYGFNSAYGCSFLFFFSHAQQIADLNQVMATTQDGFLIHLATWSDRLSRAGWETLDSLPLFIAGIAVMFFGGCRLLSGGEGFFKKGIRRLVGFYALYIVVIFGVAVVLRSLGSDKPATSDSSNSSSSQTNQSQ